MNSLFRYGSFHFVRPKNLSKLKSPPFHLLFRGQAWCLSFLCDQSHLLKSELFSTFFPTPAKATLHFSLCSSFKKKSIKFLIIQIIWFLYFSKFLFCQDVITWCNYFEVNHGRLACALEAFVSAIKNFNNSILVHSIRADAREKLYNVLIESLSMRFLPSKV